MKPWISPATTDDIGRTAKGTIWNLQLLRAIAATMVLVSHLYTEVNERPMLARGFHPVRPVWLPGGVDIFFIVSGFIMFTITRRSFNRPGATATFVMRRLARLMPPYWFFTALALATMVLLPHQMARHDFDLAEIVTSLLLIPHVAPDGQVYPILILGYTLELEAIFYLLFAAALPFRRGVGLAILSVALVALALPGITQSVPLPMPVNYWANPILIEFLYGMGLAALFGRGVRLPLPAGLAVAAAGVGAMVAVQAMGWVGLGFPWRFLWAGGPALLLCAGLVLLPNPARAGPARRAAAYLGDASYALYLSHPFVLSAVAMAAPRLGVTNGWLYVALAFAGCMGAALAFFTWVENPTHRWLARRLATGGARPGVA